MNHPSPERVEAELNLLRCVWRWPMTFWPHVSDLPRDAFKADALRDAWISVRAIVEGSIVRGLLPRSLDEVDLNELNEWRSERGLRPVLTDPETVAVLRDGAVMNSFYGSLWALRDNRSLTSRELDLSDYVSCVCRSAAVQWTRSDRAAALAASGGIS